MVYSKVMHSTIALLSNHIKRTVTGPMWHGPALAELLTGVSASAAAAKPVPHAHSIWEIVLHVTAWAEIANERIHGRRIADPSPREDWPPVGDTTDAEWKALVERLLASHRAIAADVRRLEEARLQEKVPGLEYTFSNMLHGVIEHGTYHGGQIAILKRALAS